MNLLRIPSPGRRTGSLLLAGAALVAGLLFPAPPARAATDAEIRCEDALGQAGRTARLRARLERKGLLGINPDVEEEPLDFYLVARDGRALAEAAYLGGVETDGDGYAVLEWQPPEPGQYQVEVRVRRGSDYVALPGNLILAAPPAGRPMIVVHLDGTVHQASNLTMFRGTENAQIPAAAGAQAALRLLATHYQLVYLTDLDATFTNKFRDWLQRHDVPPAPVLFWSLFERSLSHETYLTKLLEKLRQDHPDIVVGIGAQPGDGKVFVSHGLGAIVLSASRPEELVPEALHATSWEQVVAHVAQLHRAATLVGEAAGRDPTRSRQAVDELVAQGKPGIGYVHRFAGSRDLGRATAAALVIGRIRANEAFLRSLDLSTPNRSLAALIAAWRYGEPGVVLQLYRDRAVGQRQTIPAFQTIEVVSRTEPGPNKIAFKLRLVPAQGEAREQEVAFVQGDDRLWRVDVDEKR